MGEFELEPGEVIVQSVRQHIFVLLAQVIPLGLLAFAPLAFILLLSFLQHASPEIATALAKIDLGRAFQFFSGLWLLLLWTAAFSIFTRFYLTIWIITNMRIVYIKQHAFFSREVSSFLLARVQDVTTDVSGVLGTVLGFGHLEVQTAGNEEEFAMSGIAQPTQVRDLIMSLVAQIHHGPFDQSGGL